MQEQDSSRQNSILSYAFYQLGAGENPQVPSEILIRDLSQVQCSEKLGYSDRTRTLVTPPTCLSEHVALCHLQELCPNQWISHLPNTVQTLL